MHEMQKESGLPPETFEEEEDIEETDDFQFGVWLRHRRIDGALNRVPRDFYAVCFLVSLNICNFM